MHLISLLVALFLMIDSDSKSPKDFRWENRLLILFDCDASSQEEFGANVQDLKDRKLLYFTFEEGDLIASNFAEAINQQEFLDLKRTAKTKWVLVGLDGGVKASGENVPVSKEIFRRIDSMPMRQSEIRKGNGNVPIN